MIFLYFAIFVSSCILLIFSGTWVVSSLTRIARFLRWKEFIVAFILMAFATSIPELFVGITSAISKIPQLSFGDIMGANIIDLSLAIGLVVLFLGSIELERSTTRRNSIIIAIIAFLPLLLVLDGDLSRIDGIVLLLAFALYMTWLFERKEMFSKVYNGHKTLAHDLVSIKIFLKSLAVFFGSILLLLAGAEGIIFSASYFAGLIGLPLGVIGIFLVGIGTTLPEMYFSIKAGKSGHEGMILGNLMGSVVINSTLVLGIVALIHPITIVDFSPYSIARGFLLITVIFFLFISKTHERISRKEAIILIGIYLLFLITEFLFR